MNKENASKLYKIIQEAELYLPGQELITYLLRKYIIITIKNY